jgi:hypothetical protein
MLEFMRLSLTGQHGKHQARMPTLSSVMTQGLTARNMALVQATTMGDNPIWKAAKPFVNGGLSGMAATCIIQPIDMVKVRLQLGATGGPVSLKKSVCSCMSCLCAPFSQAIWSEHTT